MARSGFVLRSANGKPRSTAADITTFLKAMRCELFDGYHPERHYMRGPGPKWQEKHPGETVPQRVRVR